MKRWEKILSWNLNKKWNARTIRKTFKRKAWGLRVKKTEKGKKKEERISHEGKEGKWIKSGQKNK